jgi:hypothetical protein
LRRFAATHDFRAALMTLTGRRRQCPGHRGGDTYFTLCANHPAKPRRGKIALAIRPANPSKPAAR